MEIGERKIIKPDGVVFEGHRVGTARITNAANGEYQIIFTKKGWKKIAPYMLPCKNLRYEISIKNSKISGEITGVKEFIKGD